MKIKIDDDFDLEKIADSGQCFRFNKSGDGYSVTALDKHLFIKQISDNEFDFDCSKKDYEEFWRSYFDLDVSYKKIRGMIDKNDEYLFEAAEYGKGIRILKQDPWEMLISFIISQRKNIPAIKASIEKLCAVVGREIKTEKNANGDNIYAFPKPGEMAKLSDKELSSCGLGYRDKYVKKAANDVLSGEAELYKWQDLSDDDLMERLLKLFGVGVKVANCEILFGYHRLDAFPKDVWINRVLELKYPEGFNFDKYKPYNGVMQQYLFFYSRSNGLA
ncbi:DNA-3-methyladenine glycosylase 2 family protein [Butyrivibrio sp. X503]|uniref:DNA-3-methyladenine glycosylase family protein n=1 Tax=Butyrivibrio sp. X503 TaxID=2364878 RepID=UPI000EA8C3A4|nr:DNA glycosylase [Butyrivibrio sp. X503]RKM54699.1 DNA-3-methyladenine glycosylase 2 family protein [Butyrivibrio sp. X503]